MAKKVKEPVLNFKSGDDTKKEVPPLSTPKPKKVDTSIFERMDERDEKQIEMIEQGLVIGEPFYEDTDDVKGTIYGISFVGVTQLVRRKGGLEVVGQPLPEHTDRHFAYTVTARDTRSGISLFGMGIQLRRNPTQGEDPYARTKALSKAQRNAFRNLLTPESIQEFFHEWYETKYGKPPSPDKKILLVSSSVNLNQFKT